jgi:hypothetical protein
MATRSRDHRRRIMPNLQLVPGTRRVDGTLKRCDAFVVVFEYEDCLHAWCCSTNSANRWNRIASPISPQVSYGVGLQNCSLFKLGGHTQGIPHKGTPEAS